MIIPTEDENPAETSTVIDLSDGLDISQPSGGNAYQTITKGEKDIFAMKEIAKENAKISGTSSKRGRPRKQDDVAASQVAKKQKRGGKINKKFSDI